MSGRPAASSIQSALASGWAPRRREGLSERPLPDELVLYDPETDKAYLLNRSAAAIWDLCDGERSLPELAVELAGNAAPNEDLLREVASAVARLCAEDLLEPPGPSRGVPVESINLGTSSVPERSCDEREP